MPVSYTHLDEQQCPPDQRKRAVRQRRERQQKQQMCIRDRANKSGLHLRLFAMIQRQLAANLIQPLSLGCAEPASLPLLSLRDVYKRQALVRSQRHCSNHLTEDCELLFQAVLYGKSDEAI